MPIETVWINAKQADAVLELEEGHFLDLKSIDITPAKLTKTIAAFANADGGELYLGINDSTRSGVREWRGFRKIEDANGHIQTFENLFPLGADFEYRFLSCPARPGFVLQVDIRKTPDIKRASDGVVYIRRSAQSLPVNNGEGLRRLEYIKGISSFENEISDAPKEFITASQATVDFISSVVPAAHPEPWLVKQRLLREQRPTVAGLLLFAEEPQAALPKRCGVKIYRYRTKAREGSRETLAFTPYTVEGNTYTQIQQAVALATRVVEEIKRLGDSSLENIEYPNVAIHEILTNAVLHRDYSIADDIHIRIFDNRIEVESPGRLPAHITPANILDERFARNGTMVRIINKFPNPPNQDVGEGLNTAFAAMKKLGLKPPVVEERLNSVLVSIKHEPLASPETLIMEYLAVNATIRNKVARDICNIPSDYIVKELFGRLVSRGLIQRVAGTDRGSTAYEQGPNYSNWQQATPAASSNNFIEKES